MAISSTPKDPASEESPIFLLGPSRSGTTLLAVMLDAHPELAILPESWIFVTLDQLGATRSFRSRWVYLLFMEETWRHLREGDPEAARAVATVAAECPRYRGPTAPILEAIGQGFLASRGGRRWGEKTPAHTLRIPQIRHALAPKIVRLVRDPRDVLASYVKAWNGGAAEDPFLAQSAALVLRYQREVLADLEQEGLLLRYEDLLTDPEARLREVCRFLGIDFHPDMLDFKTSARSRRLAQAEHHRGLTQAPNPSRIGRHAETLSPLQIARLEAVFQSEMARLGYAPSQDPAVDAESAAWIREAKRASRRIHRGTNRLRTRLRGEVKARLLGARLLKRPVATTQEQWRARLG